MPVKAKARIVLEPRPPIVIDSREKLPYEFKGYATIVEKVEYGDYTIAGYEERVSVERKSLKDAYGSAGGDRERFEAHVIGLAKVERPLIVIEATLHDMLHNPPPRSKANPVAITASYIAWCRRYRIPIFFAGSRELGERVTIRWLLGWWRDLPYIKE